MDREAKRAEADKMIFILEVCQMCYGKIVGWFDQREKLPSERSTRRDGVLIGDPEVLMSGTLYRCLSLQRSA